MPGKSPLLINKSTAVLFRLQVSPRSEMLW